MKRKKSTEPLGNFTGEFTPNTIMKLEKSDSPAPSCVSVRSMEPPGNFTGELTPNPKLKLEKADSPAPSGVSLRSMETPLHFKQEHSPPNSRLMKLERILSPEIPSTDSDDIKRESITPAHSSELSASLLTKEHFRCSVCTGILKDAVSIPCGHSYCRQCITSFWEKPNQAGHYACPQCPHTYSSRPALYSNSSLAQVVHKLEHFSPVLPAQSYAGPGDVECDFCSGWKLKAVKTCLTCTASFCDTHVKEHYRIPVLQRHTLVEAVESLEEKLINTEFKQEGLQSESKEFIQTAGTSHSKKSESRKSNPVMVTAIQQEIFQLKRKASVLEDLMSTYGHNVRKEGNMTTRESISHVEDRCSLCSQSLKDPVSIPCGHSYCRQCISSYWKQPNQAGHYACPQCLLPSKAKEVHRQEQEILQQNEQRLNMLMQQAVQEQREERKLREPKRQRQMERERELELVWQWQAKRVQQAGRIKQMQQELQEAKQQQQQGRVQQIEKELEEEWMLISLARPYYLYEAPKSCPSTSGPWGKMFNWSEWSESS